MWKEKRQCAFVSLYTVKASKNVRRFVHHPLVGPVSMVGQELAIEESVFNEISCRLCISRQRGMV